MIRSAIMAALVGAGFAVASVPAQAQGLRMIQGQWADEKSGETFVIRQGGFGYEAWLSWVGQAAIGPSGGVQGSHIKVESANRRNGPGIVCYYYVSVLNTQPGFRRMTWNLREGTAGCPRSGVYSGVVQ